MIRVAIVEDHPLYREGLAKTIREIADCELVGTFESVGSYEASAEPTDVLLLDLHLPDCEGAECVERLRERATSILVISASADRTSVISAIAAGSRGYLTKAAEAEEISRAIHTVTEGDAEFLLGDARASAAKEPFAPTDREREILRLVAEGDTDADIAQRLFISVSTVRSHLDRIRDKTGRRRRADLTRLALEVGRGDVT